MAVLGPAAALYRSAMVLCCEVTAAREKAMILLRGTWYKIT